MAVHLRRPSCRSGGRGLSGSPPLTTGTGRSDCSSNKTAQRIASFSLCQLKSNSHVWFEGLHISKYAFLSADIIVAQAFSHSRTSRISFHSVSFLQPSLHCFRKQRSLRLSSNKACFRCCDSCTSRVLSWLHSFCCSRAWRPKLCTWKSLRSRAFWCSSCSYKVKNLSNRPFLKVKPILYFKNKICLTI